MDAADNNGDVALTAGAGSGKTRALVDTYLAELVRPRGDGIHTAVEELVAITFTEKAAAEMLERVGAGLTSLIKELQKDKETRAKLELMARGGASLDALNAAGPEFPERLRLLDHLIRQRSALKSAYISTIHSFCARMLWENPLAGEVDPSFTVLGEEEAEAMLRGVARRVVQERLAAGDEDAAALVRDLGFMPGGGRARGVVDYLAGLAPLLRAANTTPAAERQKAVDRLAVLEEAREGGARELAALLAELRGTGKTNSHERTLARMLDDGPGLLDGSLSAEEAGRVIEEARRRAKERAKNGDAALLGQAAAAVTLAAGPTLERVAVERVMVFTGLLEEALAGYAAVKRRMAALDFDDLEEKAKRLFIRMPAELNRRFRRVLVDEFQDINELQASIINLLAEPGNGRLFIVGDPKQSIYGFRGAQVGVFHEMTRRIGATGRVDALRESRRSIPALVEFHNRFFARLMRPSGETLPAGVEPQLFDPARDALAPTRPPAADGPAVRRIVIPNPAGKSSSVRGLEAEAIAREISGALAGGLMVGGRDNGERRPAMFGDFAILLRTLTAVETYESALRRAGIPFQTVKGRGFYHCQEILDLANLLTWLDAPSDTLAFLSLLRSPLCGAGDDTLLRLRIGDKGEPRDPIFILRPGAALPEGIESDDAGRLKGFCARLNRWRALRDRATVAELLEWAIAETDYGAVMLSRFNGEQYLANLFKLIEQARARPAEGPGVFAARLRALIESGPGEAKAGVTGGQNAVSIMSVHQSKGLEFPAVILADLNFFIPLNLGLAAFHPQAGLALRHFDLERGEWLDPPSYLAVRDAEEAARREEQKRLLYVAMTRARDRLWLTGPKEKPRGEWVKWVDEAIDAGEVTLDVAQFDTAAPG
ncbi:MAG: UvrD-helicase domain-containing protein, partial [Nitrospinae bacterium]|nr:UvrD-helicase domain-containing protein [Nitrospinota bacterium]